MNFTLKRTEFRPDGVFSNLIRDEDGLIFCVTATHSYKGRPKIPNGVYTCKRYDSPHFGYPVFMIMDVPGVPNSDPCELHIGNWPQIDSDGCELLGNAIVEQKDGSQIVTLSAKTFQRFMQLQTGVDEFKLTIT